MLHYKPQTLVSVARKPFNTSCRMSGVGVYKLDNGESFRTNCFPVRSLVHQNKEGARHWFNVYSSNVEDSFRNPKQFKIANHIHRSPSVQSESKELVKTTPKNAVNTLSTELLMAMHYVDKPSDLCFVDISERKLDSATLEGLEEFVNVAYINASDNCLTLDCFQSFPALRELELSLNAVCTLSVHAVNFPKLQVLDLSYNSLSNDAILALGVLPHLKVLQLTGNNLQTLPLNMAGPYSPPDQAASKSIALFQTLEVLILDDNKLSSPEVFKSLANLKRLRHLNLVGNYISEVPYLRLVPTDLVPLTLPTTAEPKTARGFSDAHLAVNLQTDEAFSPPLPQLQYLNLAHNKIAEEKALLAVSSFPKLSELIIHSNPVTRKRAGDPPVLTCFLQDILGIRIVCKKSAHMLKRNIVLPVDPKQKVRTKIPKLPKVPLITAAVCLTESHFTARSDARTRPIASDCMSTKASLPCFSNASTLKMENDVAAAGGVRLMHEDLHADTSNIMQQIDELFFVTEINNILEPENKQEMIHMSKCPEKLIGYEVLLDDYGNRDLDTPKPVGIQQTIRVLEYTLKNLLIYRNPRANLEAQRPYGGQQKMINLPPVDPFKSNKEKVNKILAEIKEMKTLRELPLEKVLQNKKLYRKEYKAALSLLKHMKNKCKLVYMNAAEYAAQIGSINH